MLLRELFEFCLTYEPRLLNRRIRHDGDATLAKPRLQIPLDAAPREVVEHLIGGDTGAARQIPQLLHVGKIQVADAEVADLAGALQIEKARQCLLKWDLAAPVQQVQVDAIGFQAPQAALAGRAAAVPRSVVRINLRDEKHLVTPPVDCLADKAFAPAIAVHLRRIDKPRTQIKSQP